MKTSANIIRLEVPGLPPPATDGAWDVSHMALPRHQTEMIRHFLFNTVAIAFDLDPYQLERPGRGRARAALARQVAMYLAHVACGLSLTAVGSVFGRERSTVAHACRQIEEAREKEPFDHIVGMLERSVRTIIKTSRLLQTELEQARRGGASW